MLISKEAMEGMMEMAMGMRGNNSKDLYDEVKIKKDAAAMGEGVTYVSSKKLEQDGKSGYEATFAFNDINKLKINENPAGKMMGGKENQNESFKFNFQKGKTSQLKIEIPSSEEDDETSQTEMEKAEQIPEMDEETLQMMTQMYKGMRFSVEIEFEGKIIDTNASYKEGNKIIVLDMDFDELAKDPEKLKSFQNIQNPEKMKEAFKNIHGMKVETNEEVYINFK